MKWTIGDCGSQDILVKDGAPSVSLVGWNCDKKEVVDALNELEEVKAEMVELSFIHNNHKMPLKEWAEAEKILYDRIKARARRYAEERSANG